MELRRPGRDYKNMIKSIKEKALSTITAHPRLVTFGISLAITFVVATVIGMVDHNQAFAISQSIRHEL